MAATAGAITVGRVLVSRDFAFADTTVGDGPYGSLLAANANGIQLPTGFSSRIVATSGTTVANSTYVWHSDPDGGSCFPKNGDGWVYVSNSEGVVGAGGVGVIEFAPNGAVAGGYRILTGTTRNCAGGRTPWYTWLSCEESGSAGQVYECDPLRSGNGVVRPALGAFNHEAAVVDPQTSKVYLTEDNPVGRLYRFTPTTPGILSSGTLEAASVSGDTVTWRPTSAAQPDRQGTTSAFDGGEGAWIHGRSLFFTTKGNNRVYELGLDDQRLTILYDAAAVPNAPLTGVDNITAHPASGDLFVAEDGGNMELCVIAWVGGVRQVTPFLRILGHSGSEVTGPAFSPDGSRLYLSSQRGSNGNGVTFEITGPFRTSAGTDGSGGGTTTTTTTTTSPTTTTTTTTTMPTTTTTDATTTTTASNVAPTAVLTVDPVGLHVDVDGSASSDADGSIATWAWNFGDGATATGATSSHTYATGGTYVVTLTVTDNGGATAAANQTVQVTAPGPTTFAQDAFGRTVSNGFGPADVGGPWSVSGTASNFAVSGGLGRITMPSPGKTRSVSLTQVSARRCRRPGRHVPGGPPVGGGGYYSVIVREIGDDGYGVRLRIQPGSTLVQLIRVINDAVTTLGTQTISGYVYAPGDVMHVRVQATGSATTTLRAMFWVNGQAMPTSWLIQGTDTTASLQTAGGIGIRAYLSSNSTGSAVLGVDNLAVTSAP